MNITNPFYERFKKIVSDPLNKEIEKCEGAGKILQISNSECVNMYNDVKVLRNGYYGDFSEILLLNNGVHEPSEEFVFQKVLSEIKKNSPIMYELGSYWCFYSMSFLKKFPLGLSLCVEDGKSEMQVGIKNMALNGMSAHFVNQRVSNGQGCWSIDNNAVHPHIDLLHSDIQGYELEMLLGAEHYLQNKLVDYIFVSTHSQFLHHQCLQFLIAKNYHIIAEVDFHNTFCEDGIIVAQNPNLVSKLSFVLPKISQFDVISDTDFILKYAN